MNRTIFAVFALSTALAGCSANVEEPTEPVVSVQTEGEQVSPESNGCMIATLGMSMTNRTCQSFTSGSLCTTVQQTCTANWVGLSNGGWEFVWSYQNMGSEWVPATDSELPEP